MVDKRQSRVCFLAALVAVSSAIDLLEVLVGPKKQRLKLLESRPDFAVITMTVSPYG